MELQVAYATVMSHFSSGAIREKAEHMIGMIWGFSGSGHLAVILKFGLT